MYNLLIKIDRNIKQIKTIHSLGKISTQNAKQEIENLEKEFSEIIKKFPIKERQKYLFNRNKKIGLFDVYFSG